MSAEPVTRIAFDILENVVSRMIASPDDLYWPRRLIDLVRDPVIAARLRPHLVVAIQRWAAHDPSFFVHEQYLSEQLALWAWPKEVLDELDRTLALDDPSLTHLILGRLWLEARRTPSEMSEAYARAARHLREVEEHLRIGSWPEAYCEALGVADPDELARCARDILDRAASGARHRALLAILRGAARTANWALYDAHRRAYWIPDVDGTRVDSEIVRLDAQRAEQEVVRSASATMPVSVPSRTSRRVVPEPESDTALLATYRPPSRTG